MSSSFDAIIIGGGHNGLVTAAYLAKAGLSVIVVERRSILGGAAATEEIYPGFQFNTGSVNAGLFKQEIVAELNLNQFGLEFLHSDVAAFVPQPDGRSVTIWGDRHKTTEEVNQLSERDGNIYLYFLDQISSAKALLKPLFEQVPPDMSNLSPVELFPWLRSSLRFSRSGRKELVELLRILPLPIKDYLDEWLESELLKGALAIPAVAGGLPGPYASGTTLMYLYQQLGGENGGYRSTKFVKGGTGKLSKALAAAAESYGAKVVTAQSVERINLQQDRVAGIALSSGEVISGKVVASSADPQRTFFELVGGHQLMPQFVREVRNIRYRGTTAKVNFALSELPNFTDLRDPNRLSGYIVISPSLDYIERAWDDAKYGRLSSQPVLEATIPTILDSSLAEDGKHIMSINVQYAPYHLRAGSWDEQRDKLGDLVVRTLTDHAPNLPEIIEQSQIITPLDWELEYGLTEGSIHQGQMALDQLFFMRPIAGYSRYRTPFEGLYLCGAGSHPGGGVTGLPGYLAAHEILRDLRK